MKPKYGSYNIALAIGGTATRKVRGWVLGDWGTRKEKYFWEFTHIPSGLKINVVPARVNKQEALDHLQRLNTDGPPAHQMAAIEKFVAEKG
jgi:hypothetical protein